MHTYKHTHTHTHTRMHTPHTLTHTDTHTHTHKRARVHTHTHTHTHNTIVKVQFAKALTNLKYFQLVFFVCLLVFTFYSCNPTFRIRGTM